MQVIQVTSKLDIPYHFVEAGLSAKYAAAGGCDSRWFTTDFGDPDFLSISARIGRT